MNLTKGSAFLIWLISIEFCWILGTKVSEMLLDYIIELSFEEIQIAESLFDYTIALTIFAWGYVVDRYNNKRSKILFISSSLWIFSSFLLFFSQITFLSYCLVQILWGLSFGASGPLVASYLGDVFKVENRGKLFSIFTIFIYIIKGSNIAINGIIGSAFKNWKAPTFIFACLSIAVIVLFYFFASEPKIALNEPEFQKLPDFSYNYHLNLKEVKIILGKKTNSLFLMQGFFGMMGVIIVTRYMTYWFTSSQYDGLDIDIGVAILLLGMGGALGGLTGILLVGRWIDAQMKQGNVHKILWFSIACLFLQCIFYAMLILAIQYPTKIDVKIARIDLFLQMYPAFFSFILIFNLCVFCGTPIGTSVGVARTHINLPEHRGTAGALYDLTDYIGAGIALVIGTILMFVLSSYRLTILFGSLFWLISGVIWVFISKSIKKDYENTRVVLKERAISTKN